MDPHHLIGTPPGPTPNVLTDEQTSMLQLIAREEKRQLARTNYQDFIEYMMPDTQDYNDVTKTSYVSKPVHKLMVKFWEDIEQCRSLRSALSVPPQTGKTTHTTPDRDWETCIR